MFDDFGEETFRSYNFLEDMIHHMVESGETELRFPNRAIPVDYSVFPFEIVRPEKIIKVMEHVNDGAVDDDGLQWKVFFLVDTATDRDLRFSFATSLDGRHLIFRLDETDSPANGAS
jgi:hypothetical protein